MSIINGTSPYLGGTSLKSQTKGTATPNKLLDGETSWVNGEEIIGTMPNKGAVTSSLNCGGSYTIPEGYHDGNGKITANSLASQTSATATADKIISPYTAWVNGVKLTGTGSAGYKIISGTAYAYGSYSFSVTCSDFVPEGIIVGLCESYYFYPGTYPLIMVSSLKYGIYGGTLAGTTNKVDLTALSSSDITTKISGKTITISISDCKFVSNDKYHYVVWGK